MTARIRSIATAWALGLALILLGAPRAQAGVCASYGIPPSVQAALAERTAVFALIEREFPADYGLLCDEMIRSQRHGRPPSELAENARRTLSTFGRVHVVEMVRAPYPEMIAYHAAYLRLLSALAAESDQACADFYREGNLPYPPPARIRALEGRMLLTFWRAVVAGRDRPTSRRIAGALLPGDRVPFVAALRAQGMDDAGLTTLSTRYGIERETPARQCAIGRTVARAIAAMPADSAGRMISLELRTPRELLVPPSR